MPPGFWRRIASSFLAPLRRAEPRPAAPRARPVRLAAALGPAEPEVEAPPTGLRSRLADDDQPAHAEEEPEPDAGALEESLTRSLKWRARLLTESAGGAPLGDGPALLSSLLESGLEAVRQMPFAAQRALAISRNPECNIADLVKLFERDPTLTQELLKTANSHWYRGTDDEVISIGAAVQRIGLSAVENLLLSSIVGGMLCKPGPAHAAIVGKVWSHMLRTAPLAQRLAPAFGLDPEEAFTLGLLHDVGKLAVFDHLSAVRARLRREAKVPAPFLLEMLGRLHEPLGGLAALRWGLEPSTARALGEHHRRPVPEKTDLRTEALYVAEKLDLSLNVRFEPPDWEAIWREGGITTPLAEVEALSAAA